MPSSTRQATPGPSSTLSGSRDCPVLISNTKKRAGSEDVEDARLSKKIKVDGEPLSNLSMNAKGKKKKKKKKKKRSPDVVVPEVEPKERVKPKSRMPTNNLKPASVGRIETVTNGPVDGTEHMANGDEKPPHVLSRKGKGKARSNSPTSQVPTPTPTVDSEVAVGSGSGDLTVILSDSIDHASEVANLREQLALQDIILQRHKNHLAQHQQSLTCQICLDLMHKPFALAPCGHITCYNCLIRWFTALQNSNATGAADDNANPLPENVDEVQLIVNGAEAKRGTYLRRRKTCPLCRATVLQRPVEMWGIKSMVVTLVNSKLVDLPVPTTPPNSTPGGANNTDDANNDPWRNIFYPTNINARLEPLVQNQADREDMGMYDNEDGGIYRCIDCFHEIWGGVCSGCNRGYPGHEGDDDDIDDYDRDSDLLAQEVAPEFLYDEEPLPFWGGENGNFIHPMLGHLFMSSDEGMTDSEEDDDRPDMFFDAFQPAFFGQPALEGIARVDEVSDEDEEHESDYGGSFIDDNEEGEGENMDDGQEVTERNDASSGEERSHTRTRYWRRPLVTSEDGGSVIDTDGEEEARSILARFSDRRRSGMGPNDSRGRVFAILTDDSSSGEEHDEDEEEEPAPEDALIRSQAYWSSGDEYDEDEEELAPEDVLFRSRARPRWAWSDEE